METLIDRKTDFTDAQKPLIYTLETWDVIGRELESVSADLFREASNYRNYVITHAPYLAKKDSANVENTVNFVRNDVGYKNSLMVLQNLLQNLINVVNWGMATYAELNVELDLLKNDLTAEKVDTFFTRCGLEPITIMGCKEQVESISLNADINSWQVIYNDSDEKIDVSIIDNGRITQRTRPYRPGMVGSMRVSAGNVIQVDAPDTCSVIYLPVSGGYLVIK